MSNLLEQASLVMIPSGYKEDVVYSEIPINGAGDMSFTRASNGTRINSQGLVEVVPWNLLSDTDTFSSWNLEGGTLTSGQTDPNGGSTAYKYVQVPGGGLYSGSGGVTADVKCAQVWIKSVSGGSITCNIGDGAAGFGTLNVTGTWQLFTAPYTANSRIAIYLYSISNASGIYVWHPQVNIGATAKPYFPTTDRLNVPRLTYQNGGGGCPSLLLEKQSTNLFTYSEQFDNAAWTKSSGSVTANQATSPDGTQNADLLTGEMYQQPTFTNATTYSFSVFAKKESGSTIYIGYIDNVTGFVGGSITYTYSTGVVAVQQSANGSVSGQAIDMGNGWIRVIMKYTTIAVVTFNYQYIGSTGSYVWGAQCEVSSYPTSYIPTTSSSATRVVDGGYKFNISSLIGQSEGTIFLNYTLLNNSTDDITIGITGNNGKIIWFRKNGIQFYGNGTTLLFDASSTGTMGVTYKMAFVYGQSDFRLYINGSLIGSVTSGTFTGTFDDFTFFPVGGVPYTNANKINEMVFFKTKLTNAELAQLTA